MAQGTTGRTKVFISYSHKDEEWLKEFKTHLKPIERLHGIDVWDDKKIAPGMTWHDEIRNALGSAKVAVLLVTKDFLASEFIDKEEVPPLLAAAHDEGVTILPVIVKPSYFRDVESLSRYQAANNPDKPLIELSEAERDRQFVEIVRSISQIMRGPVKVATGEAAAGGPARVQAVVRQAAAEAVADEDVDAGEEDEDDLSLEEALEVELTAMFDDPAQQGLLIFATDGDEAVELMLIAEGSDGTVICEVAANDGLPQPLQLSRKAQRALIEELGFNPPEQEGDRYWIDLGPIDEIDVADLSVRSIELLEQLFGLPSDEVAIDWQVMER